MAELYTKATVAVAMAKRKSGWRPRTCNCDLEAAPHMLRNKQSWRIHQSRLGKLRAGARDAMPREANERKSLSADELSSWGVSGQSSRGGLTTTTSNAGPQASLHSVGLTTLHSASQSGLHKSLRSSELEWTELESGEDRPIFSGEDRPISGKAVSRFGQSPPSLSDTSSENSDQISDLDLAMDDCNDSEEARFFNEVERYIGNPEDWSDSDNESMNGDLLEVRGFERGLVEEDFSGEEYLEIFDDSFPLSPSPGEVENIPDFLYDNDSEPWSEEELLSFLLYDIKQSHTVTRTAHERYTNLIRRFSPLTPFNLVTTLRRLQQVTQIHHRRFDCCSNSCMAFTESTNDHCLICLAPRYDKSGNPVQTFDYIPLLHRLRLQYSSASRADILTTYPEQCTAKYKASGVITDIWDGKLLQELRERGLFMNKSDISLSFHTDGVKLFKSRQSFHVWPLLMIINNLPPDQRFKKENVLLLGVIPGPNQPKDLDSFLRPLIDELKDLQAGVSHVFNGSTREYFTLHAYVCTIGADTKGREQLMGISTSSYWYCFYCKTRGLHSGHHVYCPFTKPSDNHLSPEAQAAQQETVGGSQAATGTQPYRRTRSKNNSLFVDVNPANLDLRTDRGFREDAWQAFNNPHLPQPLNRVSRLPIWCELDSIIFPWAFVLDEMHLFWENVLILLFNHWRGRFFSRKDSKAKKFIQTNDTYNIKPSLWDQIGDGMQSSAPDFPAAWGDSLRHFSKHCHEFKASEWRTFGMLIAPIVLDDEEVLPSECYEAFCDLIEAIESATSDIPQADINDTIRTPLIDFLHHYEAIYYQHSWDRLETCRSQIHFLAHVADCIEWCGPMNLYAQWSCERFCGMIAQSVRNRVQANRATSLNILRQQQMYHIPFMARKQHKPLPLLDPLKDTCEESTCLVSLITNMVDIRIDSSERRSKRSASSLVQNAVPLGTLENIFIPPQGLHGPMKCKIKMHIRSHIFRFLKEWGLNVPRGSIPQIVTAYQGVEAPDGSYLSSDLLKQLNATRSRSYAEYLWRNSDDKQPRTFYGKVLLFLSFRIEESRYPELFLALVQDFDCENQGRLKRIVRVDRQDIICASDVLGMVAVIKNGINNRSYIVKQRTALIG